MVLLTAMLHELKLDTKKSRKSLNSSPLPDHIGFDGIV